MRIETPFIAMVIMSMLFLGMYSIYTDVATDPAYDVSYDDTTFNVQGEEVNVKSAFNTMNETKDDMDNFTSEFSNMLVDKDLNLFSFFNIAKLLGQQVYKSMNTVKNIITIIIEMVGLPADVLLLFSIVLVVFVILIVLILLGRSIVN